jgi:predicted DNA-binding WGR domain protein
MARKQSNFTKLANKITAQYLDKGFSREEAEKIGKATAYKIGVRKYGKTGMAKRAAAGRKRAEGTEVMWDDDEWVLVKDNTVADVIADEYLDMGEDYDDADEYARRASKKMSAESKKCDLCNNETQVKEVAYLCCIDHFQDFNDEFQKLFGGVDGRMMSARGSIHPCIVKDCGYTGKNKGFIVKNTCRDCHNKVTKSPMFRDPDHGPNNPQPKLFNAASTAAPNLAREKSNIRDAVRSQIDPNFNWNQCLWGPFAVRFEASDSNKFYMVWVYDHNGAFRALGAYGGMGQSPRLQDILTTRDRGAAEKAAAKKLKAKERKGYFNYSAEYSNAIVQFEDGSGFSSASAPPNDIHFGADTNPDEYNPYAYIPGIEEDVLAAENQVFALTYWISEGINIDEISDVSEALELYLSLSDDITQMEDLELQKHPRYEEAKRLQSELSYKLDELQVPIIVKEEIEFDSENMERVASNVLKGVAGAIVALFGIKMWTNRK